MRWQREHFQHKETIVTFLCDKSFIHKGIDALKNARRILEDYCERDPEFQKSMVSYEPMADAPALVKRMAIESGKMGIGPMASVAGTFADAALFEMIQSGATDCVVDNGGDIACLIEQPITVGIYSGQDGMNGLAFEIEPRNEPLGICTSSGTVGHSFSYGKADAAVVLSKNIPLADAAATALANGVKGSEDLENCFQCLESIPDIEGALVIYHDQFALWGQLPQMVHSHVSADLITKGKQA